MDRNCADWGPEIAALVDSEPAGEGVKAHLASCPSCRVERDSQRALKEALRRVRLPAPPRARRRPVWASIPAAGVAALFLVAILLSLPGSVPEVVALSSRFHDEYLEGRLTLSDIGLKPIPGTDVVGGCPCPGTGGSPFVVYRRGRDLVSLLATDAPGLELPSSARRTIEGREYHAFQSGRNTVVVCRAGRLAHVWVSRLGETELVRTALATLEGSRLFSGQRVSLAGVT